jgi:hypothetical protein
VESGAPREELLLLAFLFFATCPLTLILLPFAIRYLPAKPL